MTISRLQIFNSMLIIFLFLSVPVVAQEAEMSKSTSEQQAWIVNDYRYIPDSPQDDPDLGLSLCSTRCNAMTSDYRNVIDPGGWILTRVAENKELTVELNNPFIGGHCICVADEYIVTYNEFNRPALEQ